MWTGNSVTSTRNSVTTACNISPFQPMSVFCYRIKGMLSFKITDDDYMCGQTSEHPQVFPYVYIRLKRSHFWGYSFGDTAIFLKLGQKNSFLQFISFLIEETLFFQMYQTTTRSDLPFLFYGEKREPTSQPWQSYSHLKLKVVKTLKPFFPKLCFSKIQLQIRTSLGVLHLQGSERYPSIRNFIWY